MADISKSKLNQGLTPGLPSEGIFAVPRAYLRQRPKVKVSSAAAFMFLPQFRMSFQGLARLYPVFIRLFAQLLAQAGLIPESHPSLNYGEKGVQKIGFHKLMGEAWFFLRTKRATPYQWSLFGAAVMMVVTMTAAIGSFAARVLLGFGEVAQAQLFAFSNPNDPYGKGAGVTDINTAVQPISGLPTGGMFDMRVQNNGISTDYALMMLDKILRQAAANTPNGGSVQNALAGLMQVYNTGMLVIAAIMIGWMIMSVIIDTAKTGVVGGGRHNMVWTPIRIVFALGIMFPLGSAGFSSGQYMIMKLAETGSNFGTKGWAAYVTGVIGSETLLAPFAANNATTLVNGITKLMVCQVAYNTFLQQVGGGTDPSYVIDSKYVIERKQETDPNKAGVLNRYTNNTAANICGSIYYTVNTTADDQQTYLKYATGSTPMTASTTPSNADNIYKNTGLADAITKFRDIMRNALAADLMDTQAGTLGSGGPVIEQARSFACQFVAKRYADGGDTSQNPVNLIPQCKGAVATTPTADPGAPQTAMLAEIIKSLQTAYDGGGGKAALNNYIGTDATSPMVTEMSKRGWAGMGMWYQDIASLNAITSGAQDPTATFTPGTIWEGTTDGGNQRCSGESLMGETCKRSDLEVKTTAIISDYDRWWAASSHVGTAGVTSEAVTNTAQQVNPTTNDQVKGFKGFLKNMSLSDSSPFVAAVVGMIFPRQSLVFSAVDVAATNTYPLATLTNVGHYVLGIGTTIWVGVTVLQTVTAATAWGFSLNTGFAVSALVNLLATIGTSMIMAGAMIAFYLPVLPFLRVAMAVLTWLTAVFEAVVMLPVAALMHLNTTGGGFMGNARSVWILWFEVLMRPILVVFGFVGGMVVYNSFAVFFHTEFTQGAVSVMTSETSGFSALLARLAYTVVYLGTLYSAANISFKMLDILPNGMMRWLGSGGKREIDNTNHTAALNSASLVMKRIQPKFEPRIIRDADLDINNLNSPAARAAALMNKNPANLADSVRKQMETDRAETLANMKKADKALFERMTDKDKQRFIAHKFFEKENKKYTRFGLSRNYGYSLTGRKETGAGLGAMTLGRQIGRGDRGFGAAREKFRMLDDPNLAVGNMAGVAVGDKLLSNLLANKGNRTHTSNMDMMSPEQRDAVRRKVEAQMSSADAVGYVGMSDEEQAELIEDMYATDPEMFAPGIGEAEVNAVVGSMSKAERRSALGRMAEFMDYGELERISGLVADTPETAAKTATNWEFMTRDEKADAASKFTSWENRYTGEALNNLNKEARDKYDSLSTEDKATFRELSYLKKNLTDIGSDSVEVINKALSDRFGV